MARPVSRLGEWVGQGLIGGFLPPVATRLTQSPWHADVPGEKWLWERTRISFEGGYGGARWGVNRAVGGRPVGIASRAIVDGREFRIRKEGRIGCQPAHRCPGVASHRKTDELNSMNGMLPAPTAESCVGVCAPATPGKDNTAPRLPRQQGLSVA